MKFPVNFVSIDKELEPVLSHLTGRVLNAGCGDRDISALLTAAKAKSVDNCDIYTSIPGAFVCDLRTIPRPAESYDSILCNAVLEHVPDAEAVMIEFARLLPQGGKLVVSVPFLQPYHPTPLDFRRFTAHGLQDLLDRHGFSVVEMGAVHTIAQTIGWLLWAHLEEKRSTVTKALLWLPIYVCSRIWSLPKRNLVAASSGFQMVGVKR
jgi:SAM-dependent methyltransferase